MKLSSNGKSDEEERVEQARQDQYHQQNLAQPGEESTDTEYLNELTKNELDDRTVEMMQNLMGQDMVLSYLQDAEINEIKWLSRAISRQIKRNHPPQRSTVGGEFRAFLLDDGGDDGGLGSLDPGQESLIDQAILDLITRISRSREGWQQDEMAKQVRVSRTEDNTEDENSGGLFS
jgi:hypothetical protein